jgi:hypothetical protein
VGWLEQWFHKGVGVGDQCAMFDDTIVDDRAKLRDAKTRWLWFGEVLIGTSA